MFKRITRKLLLLAAGFTPLATTATCDPRTGAFFFDRIDGDDLGYGYDYVDVLVPDFFYPDGAYYDDCCYYY